MNINTVMEALQDRNQCHLEWKEPQFIRRAADVEAEIGLSLPPDTTIEWNNAQREDEETQCHGLPPPQAINSPQCHQQSYAT